MRGIEAAFLNFVATAARLRRRPDVWLGLGQQVSHLHPHTRRSVLTLHRRMVAHPSKYMPHQSVRERARRALK